MAAAFLLVGAGFLVGSPATALPPSLDGDGDGWANAIETLLGSDAGDPFRTPESFAIPASCLDAADNDADGATDDADPGCHPVPAISGVFPPAGFDVFEAEMTLRDLALDTSLGTCRLDFSGIGPAVVRRGNPASTAGGREIDVEIVAMQLTGLAVLQPGSPCNPGIEATTIPVTIVEDPAAASAGKVTSALGSDFPAGSFVNLRFLVDGPANELNDGPVLRFENPRVGTLPPYHTPNNPDGSQDCYEAGAHELCPLAPLDHFQCYSADFPASTREDVALLADQFGGSPATVTGAVRFCNPVRKDRLPIFDPGAHLTFYELESPQVGIVSGAPVVVRNQFGTQTFELGDLREVAVPTQKDALAPPLALDHYTCYEVTGNQLNRPVALQDQFHSSNTVVSTPTRLCAPAAKVHGGELTEVADRHRHLTCYTIQPTPFVPVGASTSNQFGDAGIVARTPRELCVPGQKFFEGERTPPPPVAVDDGPFSVVAGGTLTIPNGPRDLLANDIDVDGGRLTAMKVSDPAHGTVSVNRNGSFTYVHDGSDTRSDSFTYRASNGQADSSPATVRLTILPGCDGLRATILGTSGGDTLVGTPGNDVIVGRGGDDRIRGRGGDDVICAGAGDDVIDGGPGHDSLFGQAGNDTLQGRRGRDGLDGGPGNDTAGYRTARTGVDVDLAAGTASGDGNDTLARVENVRGSRHADRIAGNGRANALLGWRGNDHLDGRRGADTIRGQGGNDDMFGRRGSDRLLGGRGDDTANGGPGNDVCRAETTISC